MRFLLTLAAVCCSFLVAAPATAQFDLGKAFRGEAKQAIRGIEQQIRNEIQNGRGFVQPLPRPIVRPQPLPYPPMPQPQPRPCPNPPVVALPYAPIVEPGHTVNPPPIVDSPTCRITTRKPEPAPGAEPQPLPEVELGAIVSIEGEGFGDEPGAVFIKIGQLVLTAELVEWTDELVEVQMPAMPMTDSVQATIFVMAATEELAEQMDVTLVPVALEAPAEGQELDADPDQRPQVAAGEDISVEGELGAARGRVVLVIGQVRLNASIKEWSESSATIQLPSIGAQDPVDAELIIYDAQDQVVDQLSVSFSG